MRHRTFTVLLAVVLSATLAWVLRAHHSAVLDWDEVNYVNAARQGWWANALDRGALSPRALIAFVQAKRLQQSPHLPQGYDEESDPLLLRNLHPPFVVFLVVPFAWSMEEPVLRLGQLLGAWTLLGALLVAHRWVSSRPTHIGIATVGVLGLWAGRLSFQTIQCHGWMTVWTLAAVVSLVKWLHKREVSWGVATSVFLALAIVTLHTGVVLVAGAALAILALDRPRQTRRGWREAAAGAAVILGAVLVLWPGSITKLSLFRIFALYANLMSVGKAWASSREVLWQNSLALLPLIALLPPLSWWVLTRQRSAVASWGPVFSIGVLYAIPVVPHMLTARYLLPALGAVIPLVGWFVDAQPAGWRRRALGGAVCALVALSWWETPASRGDTAHREDLVWLESTLRDHEVLADGAHILRHYLGPRYPIAALSVSYDGDALLLRERGEYRLLTIQDTAGRFVLIWAGRPGFPASARHIPALAGCVPTVRRTVLLFDCRNTKAGVTASGSIPSLGGRLTSPASPRGGPGSAVGSASRRKGRRKRLRDSMSLSLNRKIGLRLARRTLGHSSA